MRRCVVDVATDNFHAHQRRLSRQLRHLDPGANQRFWNRIPTEWPRHIDKPYAFKAFALNDILMMDMADTVLYLDSVILPVRSLEPIWERIERDGYWLAKNNHYTNYQWTADSAYDALFPNSWIGHSREVNKEIPHLVGGAFGLNLKSLVGKKFLTDLYQLASQTNAFCGPWSNRNFPGHHVYCDDMMGTCGPADVMGHRHDQTAISVLAWRMGLEATEWGDILGYPPGNNRSILIVDGCDSRDMDRPFDSFLTLDKD